MRLSILGLLLLAFPARASEPLTLEQAVSLAVEHNANVKNARLEIEKGETRVAAMRTKRLPSFTLQAIGGEALNSLAFAVQGKDVEVPRTFNMIGIARIAQPLTQLHAIGLGIKLNEAALAGDKEHERAARLAVTREVKSAYFAVLSAERYAAALDESVTAWEEVDREMNVRVAQKAALEADRLDAAARLASTKLAALSAHNALATAKDQLSYLVGQPVDAVAPAPFDAPRELPEGTVNRPDVREAQLRVEQARLDARLKAADRIPDVALIVSNTTPINNDFLPSNMTGAGISFSYEPFTWGRRKLELAEKRRAIDQAEQMLADKQAFASVEIAAYRRKIDEAAAQVAVRQLEVAAARERLRVTRARFNEKAARPDEMFNAGATLTQAAAREQEAISAYWTARADYEKALGQE